MHFFLHIAGYGEDQSKRIQKSRYDSVSVFISDSSRLDDAFHNDTNPQINPQAFARLVESGETIARLIFFFCWIKLCLICFFVFFFSGIDKRLASHVAHLFIRDPLVVYDNRVSKIIFMSHFASTSPIFKPTRVHCCVL
jgi:hypothetical protein